MHAAKISGGIFGIALLLTAPAWAQFNGTGGVDQATLNAAIATVISGLPQPSGVIPPTDTLNGAIGSSTAYMRADAPRPTISQRTTVTTDASGNWSVTWDKSFVSASPIVIPTAINGAAQPVSCTVSTRSATTAAGKCWQNSIQAVALISLTISLAPVTFASGSVMVLGIEPSQ